MGAGKCAVSCMDGTGFRIKGKGGMIMKRRTIIVLTVVSLLVVIGFSGTICAAALDGVQGNNDQENTLIIQANSAMAANKPQEAADILTQLIGMNPGRWQYFKALGDVGTKLGRYQEALESYDKAIPLVQQAAESDQAIARSALGQVLTMKGNIYIKLQKYNDAIAAYTKAAEVSDDPAAAYFNLCATSYNIGNMEQALLFANKTIAINPMKADAYFIKGSVLLGSGSLNGKNGYIVPDGTTEALKKYLELAPNGGHADDVKAMLAAVGAK